MFLHFDILFNSEMSFTFSISSVALIFGAMFIGIPTINKCIKMATWQQQSEHHLIQLSTDKKYHKAEYVQHRLCLVNVQLSLHEIVVFRFFKWDTLDIRGPTK